MLYSIFCKLPKNGSEEPFTEVWQYNNLTNEVWDAEGNLVDFSERLPTEAIAPKKSRKSLGVYSKDAPILGKKRIIRKLKIQLGMACNYHCKYCMQANYRDLGSSIHGPEAVEAFLQKLEDANIELKPYGQIEFWGGEPLVYWKTLKLLIPKLREKWGFKSSMLMITNGSLMTDEIADFLIRYQISVCISHDGPGFSLRDDKDPLFDPKIKNVWLRFFEKGKEAGRPFVFHSVITPKSADFDELKQFFKKHFAEDAILSFEGIVTDEGASAPESQFSLETARTLDSSIFKALIAEPEQWPCLMDKAQGLMDCLVHRVSADDIWCRCESGRPEVLITDLQGNLDSCQNRPASVFKIGTLKNLKEAKNTYFTHWSLRDHCRDCLLLSSCNGGCPHLSNAELNVACKNEVLYHSAFFGAVWFMLTGRIFLSAKPT